MEYLKQILKPTAQESDMYCLAYTVVTHSSILIF